MHLGRYLREMDVARAQPIHAWKSGSAFHESCAYFLSVTGTIYGSDADAQCFQGSPHQPPAPDCSCGFYAFRDETRARALAARGWKQVTMEVELSGRVLAYEHGYRAQHQRVVLLWRSDGTLKLVIDWSRPSEPSRRLGPPPSTAGADAPPPPDMGVPARPVG